MLFNLVKRVITHDVKSFQMISEEYLEIVIMGLVKRRINVVVISTGI